MMRTPEVASLPVMVSGRLAILFGSGALALLILAGVRLLQHQVLGGGGGAGDTERWIHGRISSDVGQRPLSELAPRGDIVDAEGRMLATSWHDHDLVLDPRELIQPRNEDSEEEEKSYSGRHRRRRAVAEDLVWQLDESMALAGILLSPEERSDLRGRILAAFGVVTLEKQGFTPVVEPCEWRKVGRWLRVHRGIDPVAKRRLQGILRDRGVRPFYFENRTCRDYPQGASLEAMLGNVHEDGGELAGYSGVEGALDEFLRAKVGRQAREFDRAGRSYFVDDQVSVDPVPGGRVELTINVALQRICLEEAERGMEEFGSRSVSVVMLDAETGDLLAAVTYPPIQVDPENPENNQYPRNQALFDMFEPGSTIKPLLWAWAIDHGMARWDESWACGGADKVEHIYGRRVTDTHSTPAPVPTATVLAHSSNVASARLVVDRLGLEGTVAAFKAFGLERHGLELGQGKTTFRTAGGHTFAEKVQGLRDFRRNYGPSWGQGYSLMATPFAMARAYLPFANDGSLPEPRLVKALTGPDAQRQEIPVQRRQVISTRTAVAMREVLGQVVEAKGGTARSLSGMDWRVGAKTGTPRQKHVPGDPRFTFYNPGICVIAPLERPEVVLTVLHRDIDRTKSKHYYAGSTAGPVARRILERTLEYLEVPKDR